MIDKSQAFLKMSDAETLEERLDKLEQIMNETSSMVKEMKDVFVPPLGQKPFFARVESLEKDIIGIKEAHAKDRWLVMGGVSVLAFLFSIFGDMFKKVIGL